MIDIRENSIEEIVRSAWECGYKINLSSIGYGRIHWGDYRSTKETPSPYYFFLAGLANRFGLRRILEIGTHAGGATRSLYQGINDDGTSCIVTVDLTRESNEYLRNYPNIQKIVGDANEPETVSRIINAFGENKKIDLLFIDANHSYFETCMNYGIYTSILHPSLVVIDDIMLNSDMSAFWYNTTGQLEEGEFANVVDIVPEIRSRNVSLGLIRLSKNINRSLIEVTVPEVNPIKQMIRKSLHYTASKYLR